MKNKNKILGVVAIFIVIILVFIVFFVGDSENSNRAEVKIINNFSQDITGVIEIIGYSEVNTDDGYIVFNINRKISMKSNQEKSYYFDLPETKDAKSYGYSFTAESGGYMEDTFSGGVFTTPNFIATFKVSGTPPSIKVEFSHNEGNSWKE